MKLFECQNCGQLLYFENTRCERCGQVLGYLPDGALLRALAEEDRDRWRPLAAAAEVHHFCANAAHEACNWLVPAEAPAAFCQACRLNRTIPDLGPPEHLLRWQRLEAAKHQLVYGLLRLRLPLVSKFESPDIGLAFDFLADPIPGSSDGPQILTGHEHGLITTNIAEADDAERERARQEMGEPYRTLLGHFRHEVGHYYWERLVRDGVWLESFRELFGDERQEDPMQTSDLLPIYNFSQYDQVERARNDRPASHTSVSMHSAPNRERAHAEIWRCPMTVRTSHKTVTFTRPFSLSAIDEVQAAGTYTVETEEELLPGVSFPAWRRITTVIFLPLRSGGAFVEQMVSIDPLELKAAQERDAASA